MISLFKKPIGIDVTDNTIKAVQLEKKGGQTKILGLSQITLVPGIVEQGKIKDEERLMEAFKELFSKAKPSPITGKKIVFGLPESQLYIHTFKLQSHKRKERNNLVLKEIEASIPLEKNNLLFSYKVMNKKKKKKEKTEVLLIATMRETVSGWQKLFQKLNLEVITFDVKSLAIFRALFPEKTEVPVCIINIGATSTDITILNKIGLRHSHTINIGGKDFTKAIAKELQIEFSQAEKKKQEVGLSDKSGRIFTALNKTLEPMIREIKELLDYFKQTIKQEIKKIILIGGSSKLEGVVDYFNNNLGLTVKKATLILSKKEVPQEYIESFGLALRNTNKKWMEDPSIPIEEYFLNTSDWEQPTGNSTIDFFTSSLTNRKQAKKIQSNKIILIAILIIGVICLGVVYFYKNR